MTAQPKAKQAEVEKRRALVAANLLAGATYRDISRALSDKYAASIGTIANDVKIILGRWKVEQVTDMAAVISVEVRRLDMALNAIWPAVQSGEMGAVDRLIKIQERRAKFLGLDAPAQIHAEVNSNIAPIVHIFLPQKDDQPEEITDNPGA